MAIQRLRTVLRGTTKELIIGIGLGAAVLLMALAVWPRPSGISGTVSEYVCDPKAKTLSPRFDPLSLQFA